MEDRSASVLHCTYIQGSFQACGSGCDNVCVCYHLQVLLQMRSELRSDADQSGSEDEARGSDSPLLGDQGEPASPSGERSGLWTGGAQADSGSPSRADPEEEDGLSLHSLTGLERLFSG